MKQQAMLFRGPAAYVQDLDRSRRFYEGTLGLEIARVMKHEGRPIAVAYTAGMSIWEREHAYFAIFGASRTADGPVAGIAAPIWENAFETPDVDAVYGRAVAAGSQFAHPLRELPWGQRSFRVYDPDGHLIDIGETHGSAVRRMLAGGMSQEQAAEKVCMPIETIARFAAGAEE